MYCRLAFKDRILEDDTIELPAPTEEVKATGRRRKELSVELEVSYL